MGEEVVKHTPYAQRTPTIEAECIIAHLVSIWEMWNMHDAMDFIEEFFTPLWNEANLDMDDLFKELTEIESMKDWDGEPFAPGFKAAITQMATARIACGFAVKTMKARKNSKTAWAYACEASRWLGILQGSISGRSMEGEIATRIFATAGATGRDAIFKPLRALAKKLAANGSYPSKRQAAKKIAPEVIKLSKELNINLSEDQAELTIQRWLKGMTFAGKRTT